MSRCLSLTGLGVSLVLCCLAIPAHADPEVLLARPGPCAEPRVAIQTPPGFAVAGPAYLHFDPRDVAAVPGGPTIPFPEPLTEGKGTGRLPCDSPDSGCGVALRSSAAPAPRGIRPVESPATPSLPPGVPR